MGCGAEAWGLVQVLSVSTCPDFCKAMCFFHERPSTLEVCWMLHLFCHGFGSWAALNGFNSIQFNSGCKVSDQHGEREVLQQYIQVIASGEGGQKVMENHTCCNYLSECDTCKVVRALNTAHSTRQEDVCVFCAQTG